MESTVDRSEIAFFDLETTISTRPGQGYAILEFGSILVCPRRLVELESYDTLVKPHDLSLISTLTARANGITADAVVSAPTFSDIADRVYDILHGRVWAGHNIVRFDCVRLREAFAQINRPPPEPKGTIDSLPLLTLRFGRRAGNMKMASLATYFGLGHQTHRSLDDVRMNLEVLKYCATVLFLESNLPDIFPEYITTRATLEGTGSNTQNHTFPVESAGPRPEPFNMGPLVNKMETETHQSNEAMDEGPSTTTLSDAFTQHNEYIGPDEVSIASITVAIDPSLKWPHRIQILHSNITMQIRVDAMRVRFGLSTKFVDHAGNPRLSFVVDVNSLNLCNVLDACDNVAKRVVDSEWKPVVSRKYGFYCSPTIRLHLPTIVEGDTWRWVTEIYHKDSLLSSSPQRFVFSRYDVAELDEVFYPGSFVDAYFSLDPYNYQQKAGIRLMAKKLIFHSN